MAASALSMRSALASGIVAKPAVRSVQAKAGLKVYARMTKDRVSLKKDSKWRSDINIYPVRELFCSRVARLDASSEPRTCRVGGEREPGANDEDDATVRTGRNVEANRLSLPPLLFVFVFF